VEIDFVFAALWGHVHVSVSDVVGSLSNFQHAHLHVDVPHDASEVVVYVDLAPVVSSTLVVWTYVGIVTYHTPRVAAD